MAARTHTIRWLAGICICLSVFGLVLRSEYKKVIVSGAYNGIVIGEGKQETLEHIVEMVRGFRDRSRTVDLRYDSAHSSLYQNHLRIAETEEIPAQDKLSLFQFDFWRVNGETYNVTYYLEFREDRLSKITRINTFVEMP